MPTAPRWLSTSFLRSFHGWKEDPQPPARSCEAATPPSPDQSFQCPCHPDLQCATPTLCGECNSFISKCHWIQLYKLPSSQFSKLSKRQLRRGSYTVDGDAGKTLHWDQNFQSRRLTKDCPLCELIGTAWEGSPNDPGDVGCIKATGMKFTVQFRARQATDEARLDISVEENAGEPKWLSLRIYHEWKNGHSEVGNPKHMRTAVAEGIAPPVAPMGKCTASIANFELAQLWIRTCIQDHSRCHEAYLEGSRHPLRLIAVGSEAEDPWLYEIEFGKDVPPYMTLSHCWGGSTPLKLTQESLESHKKGISFHMLSKTFQEAIMAVRRLNFNYIWIDSLCIIQDSIEDWQRESQFMGDIYRNSACTIAATASKDGDGGLFRVRNPLRNQRCEIWANDEHGIYIEVQGRVPLERYRREVSGGPLNNRAWTLQERYLSPRVLHFASGAIYWDCRKAHLCDYGKTIEDELSISLGFGDGFARPFQIDDFGIRLKDLSDRWQFAVEKYTRMNLTRESDRLIALSGLIKYFEERTNLESCVGIWKKYLSEHLLWRLGNASFRPPKRPENTIPSWSWASIEKPVNFFPPNLDGLALTFWYPSPDAAWPDRGVGDIDDPNLIDDIVSDMLRHMELGVDPENGYSAEKVICATYLEQQSSETMLSISAKLNTVLGGTVMTMEDAFTSEQAKEITNILQIEDKSSNTSEHRLLICQWPDTSEPIPPGVCYLRIQVEGGHRPTTDRFVDRKEEDCLIAKYALHTSGIMVLATEVPYFYTRVGYFRAIETFGKAPPPHPKGVDPYDDFFSHSWFGDECQKRTINIC